MSAPHDRQPQASLTLVVNEESRQATEIVISWNEDGKPINPDPQFDLDPTGFPDHEFAIVGDVTVERPPGSVNLLKWLSERTYTHAVAARILVARFRELERVLNLEPSNQAVHVRVARAGREIAASRQRLSPDMISLAVVAIVTVAGIAISASLTASEILFTSYWPTLSLIPSVVLAVMLELLWLGGMPERLETTVKILGAALLAYPFICVIFRLPGFPGPLSLSPLETWLMYFLSQSAAVYVLGRGVAIVLIPIMERQHIRYVQTQVSEDIIFGSLVETAFLAVRGYAIDAAIESVSEVAQLTQLLYQRSDRKILDVQSRSSLRKQGEKVVATIQHHAYMVAAPGASRADIARSLLNGAMNIHRGRWDELCQIDPAPTVKSALQRYGPRVGIASIAAALAFILPAVQGLLPPDQVSYVRGTLILTAFFALFSSDTAKLRETALSLTKDTLGKSK